MIDRVTEEIWGAAWYGAAWFVVPIVGWVLTSIFFVAALATKKRFEKISSSWGEEEVKEAKYYFNMAKIEVVVVVVFITISYLYFK